MGLYTLGSPGQVIVPNSTGYMHNGSESCPPEPGADHLTIPLEAPIQVTLFSTSFLTGVYQGLSKSLRQLSVHQANMAIPAVLDLLPNVDTIY